MPKPSRRPPPLQWLPIHGEAIQHVTTKSVMSPLLLFQLIALPTLGTLLIFGDQEFRLPITILVSISIVFTLLTYVFFALKDPDRLQSEEYLIEQKRISILGETGKPIPTIDLNAEQIPNVLVEGDEAINKDGN